MANSTQPDTLLWTLPAELYGCSYFEDVLLRLNLVLSPILNPNVSKLNYFQIWMVKKDGFGSNFSD